MTTPAKFSAYQGKGWRPRRGRLSAEIAARSGAWSPWRVDSEYRSLEAVLVHCPGAELATIRNPNAVQHLERMRPAALRREFAALGAFFRRRGIAVRYISRDLPGGPWPRKFNLMYARDLFFPTPEGAVVARMGSDIRAGEEKYASAALSGLSVPIRLTVTGTGLFEGADALWLNPRQVVCAVGTRTNAEGFRQLEATLKLLGVRAIAVDLPRGVQHLLGVVQFVDSKLALVRTARATPRLKSVLKKAGVVMIPVPEFEETISRQGMNIVTVAPRAVLMPDDCPELRRLYLKAGLTIAGALDIRELRRGAGGLACAVGVLSRRA